METEEEIIKKELTQWLQDLDDPALLNLLNSIKLSDTATKNDWWNTLTEEQQKNIQLGINDVKEYRIISSGEFWKRLKSDA